MKSYPSIHTHAVVLKRSNVGETDRVITLFTQKHGKIVSIAKGCRNLHSSRLSTLEPGNLVDAYFLPTKGLPILTQTQLINDFVQTKQSLKKMKQLLQVLEIVDALSVEDENTPVFVRLTKILEALNSFPIFRAIRSELSALIEEFGFQPLVETQYQTISEYVATLSDKNLKSFEFLTIR